MRLDCPRRVWQPGSEPFFRSAVRRELEGVGNDLKLGGVLMMLTDDIRAAETCEELLNFDISDEAIERAAPIIGGVASVVTLNFGTAIVGNCACPCIEH
jgi:hypothetical protein